MKILIINRWNTSNLGDQAIGYALERMCMQYGEVVHADLCTSRGTRVISQKVTYNLDRRNSWIKQIKNRLLQLPPPNLHDILWYTKNKDLYKVLKNAKFDLIIIGGGELIGPGIFSVALKYWNRQILRYQQKAKVLFFGVGISSNCTKRDIINMQNVLRLSNDIFVRDTLSKDNLLKNWGLHAQEIPDVVFSQSFSNPLSSKIIRHGILYGITEFARIQKHAYLPFASKEDYYSYSLKEIMQIKDEVVTLFYTTQNDLYACHQFQKFYFEKTNIRLKIAEIDTLTKLVNVIEHAKAIYSPRMHACILGMLSGTEIHPILISPKMESFSNKYLTNKQNITIYSDILYKVFNKYFERCTD